MPDTTAVFAWPKPILGDSITDLLDVGDLADAIEATFDQTPIGDPSNSQVLGSSVDCNANTSQNLLEADFTLTRSQYVLIGAKARFLNHDNARPFVGLRIQIDGSTPDDTLTLGPVEMAANGNVGQYANLIIPPRPVLLSATSHAVQLRADRDSTSATVTAQVSDSTLNSHSYHLTALTIVV